MTIGMLKCIAWTLLRMVGFRSIKMDERWEAWEVKKQDMKGNMKRKDMQGEREDERKWVL